MVQNKTYYLRPGTVVEFKNRIAVILELQGDSFYLLQFRDGFREQSYGRDLRIVRSCNDIVEETEFEKENRLSRIAKQGFEGI